MLRWIRKTAAILGLPFTTEDTGQEVQKRPAGASVSGYYAAVDTLMSQEKMLAKLDAQGYRFSEAPQGGGGGLMVTLGKAVIDSSGAGMSGVDDDQDPFGYGQGTLNLGYVVAQNRLFRLYPLVGIGGAGGGIAVKPQEDAEDDAAGAGEKPDRPGAFVVSAGVGLDVSVRVWRASLLGGLRVGLILEIAQPLNLTVKPRLQVITGTGLHFTDDKAQGKTAGTRSRPKRRRRGRRRRVRAKSSKRFTERRFQRLQRRV